MIVSFNPEEVYIDNEKERDGGQGERRREKERREEREEGGGRRGA